MKKYYLNTDGVLFVCDLTSKDSFVNLKEWIISLFNTIGVTPFIIMVNKSDLANETSINQEKLIEFAEQYSADFFYTSAKTGTNVNLSFERLSEIMALQTIRLENIKEPKDVLKEIVADYCIVHGGQDRAMPIINHQFKQVGANINNPTKEQLLQVIERLTQVTKSFKGDEIAREERSKYLRLVHKLT